MGTNRCVRERERDRERESPLRIFSLHVRDLRRERDNETLEERERAGEGNGTDVCVKERKTINI